MSTIQAVALWVFAAVLIAPASSWLARARWVRQEPRAALVLWQSFGLATGLALVGCAMVAALAPLEGNVPTALREWARSVIAGDFSDRLSVGHWALLAGAFALLTWLLGVTFASACRMWWTKWRHRDLVDLVAEPLASRCDESSEVTGVRVVDHPSVAAYCLPGRASRVVVTSGALHLLSDEELAAVLAHEHAHVRERHDLVVLPFVAWAAALPMVRGAALARTAVADLVELVADDRACVGRDRRVLATALARCGLAGGPAAPDGALAIASTKARTAAPTILRRVDRLLHHPAGSLWHRLGAYASAALVVAVPVALLIV